MQEWLTGPPSNVENVINELNREFPAGTFVRSWYHQQDREWNSYFGYVAEPWTCKVHYAAYNQFHPYTKLKNINVFREKPTTDEVYVTDIFFMEHATMDEFKEYAKDVLNSQVKHAYENMLLSKKSIRHYRKLLRNMKRNIETQDVICKKM